MNINSTYKGDCLQLMKDIASGSIDMILCDLPYGTTQCKWDTIIPFEELWEQYNRIIKPNGAIVLTAQKPFSAALLMSNVKNYRHSFIWEKTKCANFLSAKACPLRYTEEVLIFCKVGFNRPWNIKPETLTGTYNPQMTDGSGKAKKTNQKKSKNLKSIRPSPSGEKYILKADPKIDGILKYPKDIIKFSSPQRNRLHPTQKPVALLEYLIKTYSNEGELILDNCAGSGSTGVACQNLKRKYILMEKEEKYYDIIIKRLAENQKKLNEQLF
jgi:DNA modification methylase